jgi:hypothetical protein
VRSLAALFLAGAVYGWFTEGVLVRTMYDDLPWNIVATGLSWHALITVLFGWYCLQWALRFASAWRVFGVAALAGIIAGAWALTWWVETGGRTPISTFAFSITIATLILILAYWLISLLRVSAFRPTRAELAFALLAALAWFAFITTRIQPLAPAILLPLLLIVFLPLYRNRHVETRSSLLVPLATYRIRAAIALALPLAASAVYALAFETGFWFKTGIALYLVTVPIGFLLLAWALISVWRTRRAPSAHSVDQASQPVPVTGPDDA